MIIKLFDVKEGVLSPTEHCYALPWLNVIMEQYPEEYLTVYKYLFYMTCPNAELNPYFNIPIEEKEEIIMGDIEGNFSLEDEVILIAKEKLDKLFETPIVRAHRGMFKMLDRLAKYMENTEITHGRDGNLSQLVNAAKNFNNIKNSFKGVSKDLAEEQKSSARGGATLAYDQL